MTASDSDMTVDELRLALDGRHASGVTPLPTPDLTRLRDDLRKSGDVDGARACSVVLEAREHPHRWRGRSATLELAKRTVEERWETRAMVESVDDAPTLPSVPRTKTGDTKPERTPTDEEIAAEWQEALKEPAP